MISIVALSVILLAGLLPRGALAQGRDAVLSSAISARRSELIAKATTAHAAEKRHSKKPYCQDRHYTQGDLNACAARELGIDLTYYRVFSDAIAQLIEIQEADAREVDPVPYRKASVEFRTAEKSWQDYSDKACSAVASQNEGGSMQPLTDLSCRVQLTQRHMEELATVFSFLWDSSDR